MEALGTNRISVSLLPYTSTAEDSSGDWVAGRAILVYGIRVGIRTNRPEFLERILDHAPPLWKPTGVPLVERLFSFHFGKSRERSMNHLLDNMEAAIRSRSLNNILEAFEVRLKMYVAEMARRRVFVHAGVVGWQKKAILIPGHSMSGKTSLVAELVKAGATYYSDEYAVLDALGRVHPYPQPLAIRQAGSPVQRRCGAEEIGGKIGTKPLPVGMVIVSRYREGFRWRPARLSAGQAVLELLAHTIPARRKPEVVMPALQKAALQATIWKGTRGEAEETARLILKRYVAE